MDPDLERCLRKALFRFKSVDSYVHPTILKLMGEKDISTSEMGLMAFIQHNSIDSIDNTYMSEIPESLYITKAAISQSLTSLEKKGMIKRQANMTNRRKQIVTLTEKGVELMRKADLGIDRYNDMLIESMGEEELRKMLKLFNHFADIVEALKSSIN